MQRADILSFFIENTNDFYPGHYGILIKTRTKEFFKMRKFIFYTNELLALCVHMNLMRKTIKKHFKKTYKNEREKMLSNYDSLINLFESEADNKLGQSLISLTTEQYIMLRSFVDMYVTKVGELEGFNKKKNEHYKTLNDLLFKLKEESA